MRRIHESRRVTYAVHIFSRDVRIPTFTMIQIVIDSAIFPKDTTGAQLNVIERKNLWQDGLKSR